ncbi:MAG: sugar kinase [Cyclobacteriaceae bacterium]|nr:sugar kinase [Cyclobacteriaceae bacterium]
MSMFVSLGEVLLRLSAPGAARLTQATSMDVSYGGSEANIAAALASWGISAAHVTVLPKNELGQTAVASLRSFSIDTAHIQRAEGRMGIYFLEHGHHVRSPKVVYDRYHSAFALDPLQFDWETILAGAKWFHWSGITPAISAAAATACKNAIAVARRKGVRVSADINYRRVLWQYGKKPTDMLPELVSQSDMIMGAPADVENCLGISAPPRATFAEVCELVQRQFPSVRVFVNSVRTSHHASHQQLQGFWYENKTLFQSKNHDIEPIVDRIGSGDALMAGLVYSQLHHKSPQETISFAAAAAVFKHSVPGDVLVADVSEIEAVANDQATGKLLR